MVIVRGVNVYPSAVDQIVRSLADAGEYRVTLDQRRHLPELSVEVEGSAGVAERLADALKASLAIRIPVTAVAPGTLPRHELKARRWVR